MTNQIDNAVIHKEIDLIQSIINRMAQNSFMLKGWVITIFVAVIALNVQTERFIQNLTLSIFPLAFWYIDAYYLYIERKYRRLYENRIILRKSGNSDNLYSLGIGEIKLINVLAIHDFFFHCLVLYSYSRNTYFSTTYLRYMK